MRSREPIGKWCWQWVHTFRFSSSSLSKTIVLHLGHFVHNPSGISRFFDFAAANFGFLTKVVLWFAGGGVTAGSAVSSPRVFFVNKVDAILPTSLSFIWWLNKPSYRPIPFGREWGDRG